MTTTTTQGDEMTATATAPASTTTEVALGIAGPLVSALDAMWAAIRRHNPDVPEVVLAMAAGRTGRSLKYGHYAHASWERAGEQLPEVFFGGEGLARGAVATLGTGLHEAAHAIAAVRRARAEREGGMDAAKKWQETSRQGRWHNKVFAEIAREVGIEVEKVDGIGYSKTTVPDETAALYAEELAALDAVLTAHRRDLAVAAQGTTGRGSNNNGHACKCQCEPPRSIRASATTLQRGEIICGACREPFEPEDI